MVKGVFHSFSPWSVRLSASILRRPLRTFFSLCSTSFQGEVIEEEEEEEEEEEAVSAAA